MFFARLLLVLFFPLWELREILTPHGQYIYQSYGTPPVSPASLLEISSPDIASCIRVRLSVLPKLAFVIVKPLVFQHFRFSHLWLSQNLALQVAQAVAWLTVYHWLHIPMRIARPPTDPYLCVVRRHLDSDFSFAVCRDLAPCP